MGVRIHTSLSIEGALNAPAHWTFLFERPGGGEPSVDELRAYLFAQAAAGRKFIPITCPAPLPDGSCPGHRADAEEPAHSSRGEAVGGGRTP